ncbi:hypothetical protein ACFYS8_36310 [Kitasatospora sp. NPDC004615]|uniref:hypothetical protein n=1 Tax=Kitasatospora sp. NPDC004615 TaxID=3364017 RepID=UPI00369560A4
MPTTTLLLPAEPDVLGALYALDEPLMLQLRPMPDEDGQPWSPLPDYLDAESVCGAYDRVLDALRPIAGVVYGRANTAPGVPVLVGAGGVELVQLLAADVDGQDLISLSWLSEAVTAAGGDAEDATADLSALLDDLASDRHGAWWLGEGTNGRAVAAWAVRALAVLEGTSPSDPVEQADRRLLIDAVRGAAGADRIELTVEQEDAYGRYMRRLIRRTAPSAADAHLTAWVAGV